MADFQFNTNLGPAAQQGTNIADMVNLARGVQAYQQSQELNPLAVQKAKIEIEQAQKLNPLAVREKTAQAGTAELNLSSAQTDKLYGLASGVLNDPRLKSKDSSDVMGALYEARQRASTYNLPKEVVDGVFNPLFVAAKEKPESVKQSINNIVDSQLSPESKRTMQTGGTIEINGLKYQYAPASGKLEEIGAKPQNTTQPAEKPATKTNPTAQTATQSGEKLVPIDMPLSGLQMNTQQAERYALGQKDFDNANERQKIAKDSALASQQIKRTLKEAAGSKPQQIIRQTGKAFFGNAELDTLVKNLAEQQIRQAKLMGVSSVNAENDLKTANGSENITAEALAHIVDRAEAMNLAADKYNQALTKMQAKYGKQNAYIHNDNFQRAWANNYDPVAFLIQNINASNIPKKEKEKAIDYYTEGMSQDQLDDLAKKQKNLKRLERGDF